MQSPDTYQVNYKTSQVSNSGYWPMKKHIDNIVVNMRMLRWTNDKTRKIGQEMNIRDNLRIAATEDERRENRLRWCNQHIQQTSKGQNKRSNGIQTTTKRKMRRPKKTWLENIRNDLNICNLTENKCVKPRGMERGDRNRCHLVGHDVLMIILKHTI